MYQKERDATVKMFVATCRWYDLPVSIGQDGNTWVADGYGEHECSPVLELNIYRLYMFSLDLSIGDETLALGGIPMVEADVAWWRDVLEVIRVAVVRARSGKSIVQW